MLAAVVIILYCGSRSVLFMVPVVLLGAVVGTAMSGRGLVATKIVLVAAMFAALVAIVMIYIVPERLDAYMVRFTEADYYESSEYQLGTFGRILGTFTNVFALADRVPFFGYGAGYGTNAAVILGYIPLSLSAESDWDRHVYDLGMIGWFAVALFRIWMTGWLGWRCLLAAKLPEGTLAMTLYSAIAVTALSGQLVGQNSINGLGWFAIGLCAAASSKRQVVRSASAKDMHRTYKGLPRLGGAGVAES
ncbi:hypothetical protein A1351_06595 [Methylosinus sp. R-45379]|nr:hypothetical protein A1351_06595 [Methylosinus sp. R-45379]